MSNVLDLVNSVKKQKNLDLFEKISFVCRDQGREKLEEHTMVMGYHSFFDEITLQYRFFEMGETSFQKIVIKDDLEKKEYNYFLSRDGVFSFREAPFYKIPQRVLDRIEDHYQMALCN